jgi:peptide/nickel transport system ATP-binding protein
MTGGPAPHESLLAVSQLSVTYRTGGRLWHSGHVAPAVDGVSLTVESGQFVGLVGESGSGKTSLVNAVLGLAPISSGSIRLAGIELAGLRRRAARRARRAVQLVMQDPFDALDPFHSVRKIVEEPLLIHERGLGRTERSRRVDAALSSVALEPGEFADRRSHELSGGQRQRIAIAAALVVKPSLLLADEPVSMLDVSIRASVLHLLDSIRTEQKMGILMITHDLPTALAFSEHVLVMRSGVIVAEGTPDHIRNGNQDAYTRELLDATPGHRDEVVAESTT